MKIGIVGTGKIVPEALTAIQNIEGITSTCIFARPQSKEKGEQLAKQFGIPTVFTDYAQMLSEGDFEFAYIGNINSVHYEYSMKAMAAGKHLIIEKPMCTASEDVETICRTAIEKHLYVFEAVTFLHAPFFLKIKAMLPELGPVRLIQCNYSKYSTRYDHYLQHVVEPVFNPELGGGTLMDLNIYNLNFVTALFGAPSSIHYAANKGFNGIDTSGTVLLSYPSFVASCTAAKDSFSPCFIQIQGEKGWIRVNGSPDDFSSWEYAIGDRHETFSLLQDEHRMTDEFRHFLQMFESNDYDGMKEYLSVSCSVLKEADEARRQVGLI